MTDAEIESQYEGCVRRAGLRIPADRRAVMLNAYRQVAAWSALVRSTRRPGSAEPANIYALDTITRLQEAGR